MTIAQMQKKSMSKKIICTLPATRYHLCSVLLVFTIISLGLLTSVCSANSTYSPERATPKGKLPQIEPDSFEFQLDGRHYIITNNGKGIRYESEGKQSNFAIPLEEYFYIEKLYFFQFDDSIVFIYEVTDQDVGAADIIRMNLSNFEVVWDNHIPGFNLGESIVRDNFIYLTALGFIAKLDLDKGEYVWKYSHLYKKAPGTFNSFERPQTKDNSILFTEKVPLKKVSPITIVVNDETGEIVSPW